MDYRQSLAPQAKVLLNNKEGKIPCTVVAVCGSGASCVVYDAILGIGDRGLRVRLRECYPRFLRLTRNADGMISAEDPVAFEKEKEKFRRVCRVNSELQNTPGLINKVPDIFGTAFAANGTLYAITQYSEGMCYHSIQREAETPAELITRMLAIANVIKKLHDSGWLYLDMKPSNVFFLKETNELATFFDFDSLVEKAALRNGGDTILLSSPAYAAPEVIQNDIWRIDERADIYSLGATLYERIAGHPPTFRDRQALSSIRIPVQMGADYCRELRSFLCKTLSSARDLRYSDMTECINALERIKKWASDTARIDSTFSFSSACVAHTKQMDADLEKAMKDNDIVFLYGLGGIGKTTLACSYAASHRADYSKIVLLRWAENLGDTERALPIIHQTPNLENFTALLPPPPEKPLLLILDNYNEPVDSQVMPLLTCGCKVLVTTRVRPDPGYMFPALQVNALPNRTLLELYRTILNSYGAADWQRDSNAALALIHIAEGHTMTVALLAKLQGSLGCSAQTLLEKVHTQRGVMQGQVAVGERKDGTLCQRTVAEHIAVLFDLCGLHPRERQLLACLAVLGDVEIDKDEFLSWLPEGADRYLARLLSLGWLMQTERKLSLHDVVLDCLYEQLQPNAASCSAVLTALTNKLRTVDTDKKTEYSTWSWLCKAVKQRLADKPYTKQYAAFDAAYACRASSQAADLSRCIRYLQQHSNTDKLTGIESALACFRTALKAYFADDMMAGRVCTAVPQLETAWRYAEQIENTEERITQKLAIIRYALAYTESFDTEEMLRTEAAQTLLRKIYGFIDRAFDALTEAGKATKDTALKAALYSEARDFYNYRETEDNAIIHDRDFVIDDKIIRYRDLADSYGATPYQLSEYYDEVDAEELAEPEEYATDEEWELAERKAEAVANKALEKAEKEADAEKAIWQCIRTYGTFEAEFINSDERYDKATRIVQTKLDGYDRSDRYLVAEAFDFLTKYAWGPDAEQQERYYELSRKCDYVLLATRRSENAAVDQRIMEWRMAGGSCKMLNRAEDTAYCYTQLLCCLEEKQRSRQRMTSYDIESVIDAVTFFCHKEDEALRVRTRTLLRSILAAYFSSRGEKKRRYVKKQILILAQIDKEAAKEADAQQSLMLALLSTTMEKELFLPLLADGTDAQIADAFCSALQRLPPESVDIAVELCERIIALANTSKEVKTACATNLAKYRDSIASKKAKKSPR